MNEPKLYVPKCSAKLISTRNGQLMKLSFKADAMLEFIKANTNSRGYVNLAITERKQPGQYGDTHCVWLDKWEPGQRGPNSDTPQTERAQAKVEAQKPAEDDDLPF